MELKLNIAKQGLATTAEVINEEFTLNYGHIFRGDSNYTDADKALVQTIPDKQDKLTLTTKENGNIVIGNIAGQSKEFMPATPSGDPMHYAYEAAGAVWNANSGYWELNTLTDITNGEMRTIYQEGWHNSSLINICAWYYAKGRTNINNMTAGTSLTYLSNVCCFNDNIEVFVLSKSATNVSAINVTASIRSCPKLKKVIGVLSLQYTNSFLNAYMFKDLPNLEAVSVRYLKYSISFAESPKLSKESILYMISNSAATSNITITLHATAYAMANADADIKSALASKTYVKLASA